MAKILIIEDDPMMSRMYQNALALKGHETESAKDGEEGLLKTGSYHPDLILLDVMMPKMNGMEVLDKLKSGQETQSIPVVMLTNLSGEKDAETAISKGAKRYLIKSDYEPQQVVDIINEELSTQTR